MRRLVTAVAAATALLAIVISPAGAVQGGTPDGSGHPYVGLSVYYDANGFPLWRCSGTMVSPTVYVTAGHCTGIDLSGPVTPAHAEIWFSAGPIPTDPDYIAAAQAAAPNPVSCNASPAFDGYPCKGDVGGTPHPHPGWNGLLTLPNTHDTGVVVLDHSVSVGVAQLAPKGYLDALAKKRGRQNVTFTVVGYGVQFERPNLEIAQKTRYVGTTQLQDLGSHLAGGFVLRMTDSGGNGTGGGGTCFGDSGGPVFHTSDTGTTYLVADISFGTKYCKGTSGAYRLDQDSARGFLDDYVAVP